jgi:hypothetical protein
VFKLVFPNSDNAPTSRTQRSRDSLITSLVIAKLRLPVLSVLLWQPSALAAMPITTVNEHYYSLLFENKIWPTCHDHSATPTADMIRPHQAGQSQFSTKVSMRFVAPHDTAAKLVWY